ncbi:MAG: hypothetical protein IKQ30_14490 [Bacteroidales bacterium]|jgi:hypothetical protein|nr:hypothetical protein [Bacteroidales bacterium]MBR4274031.1 hypothetical protein [Bacteroidales bacterium]
MKDIETELRREIYSRLKEVTAKSAPKVYERIQTPGGYAQIESMIIYMVINDHITPSACIGQIESEL